MVKPSQLLQQIPTDAVEQMMVRQWFVIAQVFDDFQSGFRAVSHGYGNGSIQCDNRCRQSLQQAVV